MSDRSGDGDRAAEYREPPGVLYLVATSHLDTQWRWTVRETVRDFLPRTLRDNFRLFQQLPEFVLSFEGAFRYMLAREYYPDDYRRLQQEVAAGRWRIAGSLLEAPDVNIPSPESLIRHALYGARFYRREFGGCGIDVFLPDCFGFGAALPSVARHCGLAGLSTSKLVKWKAPGKIPFAIGRWRGPDGAEIVAVLHPEGYGEGVQEDLSRAERWRRRIAELGAESGLHLAMMYAGVGDRGGALDEESVAWLRKSLHGGGPIRVRMAGSDQLFRDLRPEEAARLPLHRGELLLPTHGTGCLTSQAVMKRWNRRNEQLADAAERAAAAADWLGAMPYPAARLRHAWIRFLWHQMHDDLTGTSLPEAYRISWNDQQVAMNEFETVLHDALGAVGRGLDTRSEGTPLVVFNPLSVPRREVVEIWAELPEGAGVTVIDPQEGPLPCQIVERRGTVARILTCPHLAPLAFKVLELLPTTRQEPAPGELQVSERRLENHRYRVEIDPAGDLGELFDKRLGRPLLSAPARLELLADRSPRWPAWEIRYSTVTARPREVAGPPVSARIVEQGPVRVALEIRRTIGRTTVAQTYRLAAGEPGERLEVECDIDWRARNRLLKASFPTAFSAADASFDLGLGAIDRGVNCRERYEVPAQQWADLADPSAGAGLSILADATRGWDRPDRSTLRLSLLRSPGVWRKFRHQGVQDLGPHRCRYALYGHAGSWADGDTQWQAARFNQPLRWRPVAPSPGPRGRSFALLEIDAESAAVRALKREEDGAALVVRLQELAGRERSRVKIRAPHGVESARRCDGTEQSLAPEPVSRGGLEIRLGAFAPATFALRLAPPEPGVSAPRSRSLPLPLDRETVSFHGHRRGPDFDGRGRSIPGELLPRTLDCGGVLLRLGALEPGAPHALACQGQEIPLPEAGYEQLVLVGAAVGGDLQLELAIGGQSRRLLLPDWASPVGQWVRRRLLWGVPVGRERPPFVKPCSIAWVGTHRHDRQVRDLPYEPCYLFRLVIPVPDGATSLRLPRQPAAHLFAASLARDSDLPLSPPADGGVLPG